MNREQIRSTRGVVKRLASVFQAMDRYTEMYDGDMDIQPDIFSPVFSDLSQCADSEILSTISSIRNIQLDLESISKVLTDRSGCLTDIKTARNLEEGFDKLPPEIIRHIFMCGQDYGTSGVRYAFKLTLVCQRFRTIALGTSSLWATLTDSLSPKQLDLCMARSNNAELIVIIHGDYNFKYSMDLEAFLAAIDATHDRWIQFNYYEPFRNDDDNDDENLIPNQLSLIHKATAGRTFPRMISLRVMAGWALPNTLDFSKIFFASWDMPILSEFEGLGVYPCLSSASSLERCSIQFDNSNARHEHIWLFIHSLASFSNLKALYIYLQIVDEDEEPRLEDFDLGNIPPLSSLDFLSLKHERSNDLSADRIDYNSTHALKFLFSQLDYPNLSRLDCDLYIERDTFREFRDVLPSKEKCPKLGHLSLTHCHFERQGWVSDTAHDQCSEGLQTILSMFPQIFSLYVEAPDIRSPGNAELLDYMNRHPNKRMQQLHALTLVSAPPDLTRTAMIVHQGGLKYANKWDCSRKIQIFEAPMSDELINTFGLTYFIPIGLSPVQRIRTECIR